jgi:UTP--glucose-1-phosphate uridylyltransferase
MVEAAPENMVSNYVVVYLLGAEIISVENKPMEATIEKCKQENAPSNLAVVGSYVLSDKIWILLKSTVPGAGDEIQLTSAIASLIEQEQVDVFYMADKSHDLGSKLGYMKAFVEYSMQHESESKEFLLWMNHVAEDKK